MCANLICLHTVETDSLGDSLGDVGSLGKVELTFLNDEDLQVSVDPDLPQCPQPSSEDLKVQASTRMDRCILQSFANKATQVPSYPEQP